MKKIGILTSGGDSQGMNACLKTIITMAERYNYEVVAFIGGYKGLVMDEFKVVTSKDAEMFFSVGGSFILSGRYPPFVEKKEWNKAKETYKKHGLEALIVLGGDGSIRAANDLSSVGMKMVVVPCTIDNDVFCTNKAIGFDTAVNNAVDTIDNIEQTMKTHGRVLIAETMGRHCGEIAMHAGLCSEADIIMVPEKKQSVEKIIREVGKQIKAGNGSPTVVLSEHQIDIDDLAQKISETYEKECKAIVIGYVQRGGTPTVQDKLLAIRMGVGAMDCVIGKNFGNVVALVKDEIKFVPFEKAIKTKYKFNDDLWQTFLELKKFKTEKNSKEKKQG